MAQELTLGPIPYIGGKFAETNVQNVGDFCRLTDKLFFSIYRQTSPDFVYAQISSVDDIRAPMPQMTILRTQHLLEFTSTDLYTDVFDCVRLSDQFVAVICKPATSGTTFQIRIFWINPNPDPDYTYNNVAKPPTYQIADHKYTIRQVGDPILINDAIAGASSIGARPYLLNSIVDNVMFFEYQQATGYTRVFKRLELTPNLTDLTLSTTNIVTLATIPIPVPTATVAYSVPFFARHNSTGKWTATWSYQSSPTIYYVLTGTFDPKSSSPITLTTVTGAQGGSPRQTNPVMNSIQYNTVMLPRGDRDGIIFNSTNPYEYDTMLNGVCTGVKKAYGDGALLGSAHTPSLGWWLDEKHFALVGTYSGAAYGAYAFPNMRSWKFCPSGVASLPVIRVCQYIDASHVSVSYGTTTTTSQFNTTNTTNFNTFYIYPYKTELYGDDTIIFYGFDPSLSVLKWMIKTVRLSA